MSVFNSPKVIAWYAVLLSAVALVFPTRSSWFQDPPLWVRRLFLSGPFAVFAYNVLYTNGDMGRDSAVMVAWAVTAGFLLPWVLLSMTSGIAERAGIVMGLSYGSTLWGVTMPALYLAARGVTEKFEAVLLIAAISAGVSFGLGVAGYSSGDGGLDSKSKLGKYTSTAYGVISSLAQATIYSFCLLLGSRAIYHDRESLLEEMNAPGGDRATWIVWSLCIFSVAVVHLLLARVVPWFAKYSGESSTVSAVSRVLGPYTPVHSLY